MNRSRLIRTCREHLVRQYRNRSAPRKVLEAVEKALDPNILTVAFARRFASYKRAFLLIMDPERLETIINNPKAPVQFIFAGKAHPRDNEGKDLIRQLFQFANRPGVRERFVFLEDYDLHLARHLLQGADVWLNTPRRPFEACGTSGMKAAINGSLNLSVLDGWWDEGYRPEIGWTIGNGEEYEDHAYQDAVESQALYNTLENEVIPLFYDRKNGDLPAAWIEMMKAAMKTAMEDFCSLRMIRDYTEQLYAPAAGWYERLTADGESEARRLAELHRRLRRHWKEIRLGPPQRSPQGMQRVGDAVAITVEVHLGHLLPEEVDIEIYYGQYKSHAELINSRVVAMEKMEDRGEGNYLYGCRLTCETAGRFGFAVRATPHGDPWIKLTPGLITWAAG